MSWKKDVLARLDRMEERLVAEAGWKEIARELREQNSQLLDRLMARDIPELKTYQTWPVEDSSAAPQWDPRYDVGSAGASLEIDQ